MHDADRTASHPSRDVSIPFGTTGFLLTMLCVVPVWIYLTHQPLLWLLGVVSDDAFYYLQIARNIAATGFSTFDGINPTNGYHPAWMAISTLCAAIVDDREALLRTVFLAALLCHIATSVLLARTLGALIGRGWGWIGGALWGMSPLPLTLALQGVETPFYLLSLALVVAVYLRRIDPYLGDRAGDDALPIQRTIPAKNLALFGCALGLTFLARTEGGVLALLTMLYLMIALKRSGMRSTGALLRVALITGGAALLVALPWLIYSIATVGGLGQDSGAMKMIWASAEYAKLTPFKRANEVGAYLYQSWLGKPAGLLLFTPHAIRKIVPALLGALIAWWIYRYRHVADRRLVRLTAWLVPASFLTGLIYGIFLTDFQIWHFGQPGMVLFIIGFAWGITALRHARAVRLHWNPKYVAAALCALALGLLTLFTLHPPELYPWQRDVYRSQVRFEMEVPRDAAIGSFNAGIPGYFSDRRVVNLDGLVNHAAVGYWREGRFDRYLRDAGIDYVADEEDAIRRASAFSSSGIMLRPIDSAEIEGWTSGYRRLWRVDQRH